MQIRIPVAPGELIDKLTILRLKAERISDPAKLAHIRHEQALLQAEAAAHLPPSDRLAELWEALLAVNARLWGIEDQIRDHERAGDFGPGFIALARAVYRVNDERAALKRAINLHLGSDLLEVKSYADHGGGRGESGDVR